MKTKRSAAQIKPTLKTRRKLEGLAKRHGIKASAVLNRAVDWLDRQPELIQAAVLGRFPGPIDKELAKHIIRSITQ
jgi:hypothetical protein